MSIFSDENKVKGNWVKFKNVGDEIEGTLIGKSIVTNMLTHQEQTVYDLLLPNGEIWKVGSKEAIDKQMKYVKLGQIVGFRMVEKRKSTSPAKSDAHIIQVFANPKVVNEEWLQEQAAEASTSAALPLPDNEEVAASSSSGASASSAETSPLENIMTLAKNKFGLLDENTLKTKIMEATNLAFIEVNYPQIIEKLSK